MRLCIAGTDWLAKPLRADLICQGAYHFCRARQLQEVELVALRRYLSSEGRPSPHGVPALAGSATEGMRVGPGRTRNRLKPGLRAHSAAGMLNTYSRQAPPTRNCDAAARRNELSGRSDHHARTPGSHSAFLDDEPWSLRRLEAIR